MKRKPGPASPRRRSPTAQLALPLSPSQIASFDAENRVGVTAMLARLLLEAAQSSRGTGDAHDAS
jgi:hypothetical protein